MQSLRFLQTPFWASFKGAHGWTPFFFNLAEDGSLTKKENALDEEINFCVLVRTFSIKIKKISIAYIPMAPELVSDENTESYAKKIKTLCENLKNFLPKNTMCIRIDPPLDFYTLEERDSFTKAFLDKAKEISLKVKKSKVDVQPPDTTILSLKKSEDELLASMKSKWRYNIRLAQKKGVEILKIEPSSPDFEKYFEEFFILFETTSKRDKVSFHGKDYYLDLLKRSAEAQQKSVSSPKVNLYLAKHENDYLAGIITLFCDFEAVYLYGASGNIKRNFMSTYLLQWTAICDAKKKGCPVYDFYGMPPVEDPNHPMHGLYLFKTGFGGEIVHRPGSFDFILNKTDYTLYSAAERLRAFYFKVLKKKI